MVDEVVLFNASNQRQRCEVQIRGLNFKHLADHDRACRRSLQRSAAMMPFDTAEKKVTEMTSGAGEDVTVKEGQQIDITCRPETVGTMVIWFRVLDTAGVEFIASLSNNGVLKSSAASFTSTFSHSESKQNVLTLKSFNKARDSGVYNCGSLYRGNELKFGKTTRLVGEKVKVAVVAPQATTTQQNLCTTATPCVCNHTNKPGETSPQLFCSLIILGPLAGGCGLLLLLLIITTLYCNKIRTRRCPHHYKRKPRMVAPGKQKMTNRHV